MDVQLFY